MIPELALGEDYLILEYRRPNSSLWLGVLVDAQFRLPRKIRV